MTKVVADELVTIVGVAAPVPAAAAPASTSAEKAAAAKTRRTIAAPYQGPREALDDGCAPSCMLPRFVTCSTKPRQRDAEAEPLDLTCATSGGRTAARSTRGRRLT